MRVASAHPIKRPADERLLAVLAEQIKLPMLQIARRSELARLTGQPAEHLAAIEFTSETALRLLDSYLLSLRLSQLPVVELEPVSVSAVLDDAAQALTQLSKDSDTTLEIHLSGRFEPVMIHRAGLEAALVSLGRVLIEAQFAQSEAGDRPKLLLGAHRGRTGIVTGIYTGLDNLTGDIFRRSRQLYGRAQRALPELTADSGAGVFVADALLRSMSARLRVSHHHRLAGLAATLMPSQQLTLI